MRSVLIAIAFTALAAGAASAEPVRAAPASPFGVALTVHVGLGIPHGRFGGSLEGTFWQRARLELGAGVDGDKNTQVTAMVTGLPGRRGLGIGIGTSYGRYVWKQRSSCFDFCDHRTWDRAYWVNGQVSYRGRIAGGHWQWGPYAGLGIVLNAKDGRCYTEADVCENPRGGEKLVYGGLALGRSF